MRQIFGISWCQILLDKCNICDRTKLWFPSSLTCVTKRNGSHGTLHEARCFSHCRSLSAWIKYWTLLEKIHLENLPSVKHGFFRIHNWLLSSSDNIKDICVTCCYNASKGTSNEKVIRDLRHFVVDLEINKRRNSIAQDDGSYTAVILSHW